MRALPKLELLRAPTSEDQLGVMHADVRARAENRPGVYRMLTAAGEVVYVGKSKRVRTRLLSYFRCNFPEEKGARILREADSIEWDYAPSEFAALLQELRLIKQLRPRFNVAMKRDGRNFCFLKLARGAAPAGGRTLLPGSPGPADPAWSSLPSMPCSTLRVLEGSTPRPRPRGNRATRWRLPGGRCQRVGQLLPAGSRLLPAGSRLLPAGSRRRVASALAHARASS